MVVLLWTEQRGFEGSEQSAQLRAYRRALVGSVANRDMSPEFEWMCLVWPFGPSPIAQAQLTGPSPDHTSYRSYATFRDLDGKTRRELAELVRCVHSGGAGQREAATVKVIQ